MSRLFFALALSLVLALPAQAKDPVLRAHIVCAEHIAEFAKIEDARVLPFMRNEGVGGNEFFFTWYNLPDSYWHALNHPRIEASCLGRLRPLTILNIRLFGNDFFEGEKIIGPEYWE